MENFCTHSSTFPKFVVQSLIVMTLQSQYRLSVPDFTKRRPKFDTKVLFVVSKTFVGKILLPAIRFSPANYQAVVNRLSLKTGTKGSFSPQH
jgi:hypothetical protein